MNGVGGTLSFIQQTYHANFCVPGAIPGTGDAAVSKADKHPHRGEPTVSRGGQVDNTRDT